MLIKKIMSKKELDKELENFVYKHKINTKSLLDLLPQLSSKTLTYLLRDLTKNNENDKVSKLFIFTDGGCKRNGSENSKAAYSVFFTEDQDSPLLEFNTSELIIKDPTNNRAELSGILYIFKIIRENTDLFLNKQIVICTDSMYSINCIDKWSKNWLVNEWKNSKGQDVKNKEIIQKILKYQSEIPFDITFKHVFSHVKPPTDKNSLQYYLWYGNNKVDENINELLNQN